MFINLIWCVSTFKSINSKIVIVKSFEIYNLKIYGWMNSSNNIKFETIYKSYLSSFLTKSYLRIGKDWGSHPHSTQTDTLWQGCNEKSTAEQTQNHFLRLFCLFINSKADDTDNTKNPDKIDNASILWYVTIFHCNIYNKSPIFDTYPCNFLYI